MRSEPHSTAGGLQRCPVPRKAANLGEWLHEPYRKGPIVAFLKAAEWPVLMCEVAKGCNLPVSYTNRVLLRLHAAGQVTRYKLPIKRPGYCHKRKISTPGTATRHLFVYAWGDRSAIGVDKD